MQFVGNFEPRRLFRKSKCCFFFPDQKSQNVVEREEIKALMVSKRHSLINGAALGHDQHQNCVRLGRAEFGYVKPVLGL